MWVLCQRNVAFFFGSFPRPCIDWHFKAFQREIPKCGWNLELRNQIYLCRTEQEVSKWFRFKRKRKYKLCACVCVCDGWPKWEPEVLVCFLLLCAVETGSRGEKSDGGQYDRSRRGEARVKHCNSHFLPDPYLALHYTTQHLGVIHTHTHTCRKWSYTRNTCSTSLIFEEHNTHTLT